MIELSIQTASDAFRTIGPSEAIPDDFVVPYYLDDRKLRISIARVKGRLYAFDDLCTCAREACPLSAGLARRNDDHVSMSRLSLRYRHRSGDQRPGDQGT